MPHVNFQQFLVIQLFCCRKDGLICNSLRGLYLVNELATMTKVFKEFCTATDGGAALVLSSLNTYDDFLLVLHCFGVSGSFWTLLPTWVVVFFFFRLVSQAKSFLFLSQGQSHIGYEYWKLRKRKGLPCETKPTVCKAQAKLTGFRCNYSPVRISSWG